MLSFVGSLSLRTTFSYLLPFVELSAIIQRRYQKTFLKVIKVTFSINLKISTDA